MTDEQVWELGMPVPGPKVHLRRLDGTPHDAYSAAWHLVANGWIARHLRGSRMRSWDGLWDETIAACQFPPWFGRNGNALIDCLSDLPDNGRSPRGLALVISEADQLHVDEANPQSSWSDLVDLLDSVATRLSEPVARGEWWDRPALPFVVVMQGCGQDGLVGEWRGGSRHGNG